MQKCNPSAQACAKQQGGMMAEHRKDKTHYTSFICPFSFCIHYKECKLGIGNTYTPKSFHFLNPTPFGFKCPSFEYRDLLATIQTIESKK